MEFHDISLPKLLGCVYILLGNVLFAVLGVDDGNRLFDTVIRLVEYIQAIFFAETQCRATNLPAMTTA